jgi:hypothetical protein
VALQSNFKYSLSISCFGSFAVAGLVQVYAYRNLLASKLEVQNGGGSPEVQPTWADFTQFAATVHDRFTHAAQFSRAVFWHRGMQSSALAYVV